MRTLHTDDTILGFGGNVVKINWQGKQAERETGGRGKGKDRPPLGSLHSLICFHQVPSCSTTLTAEPLNQKANFTGNSKLTLARHFYMPIMLHCCKTCLGCSKSYQPLLSLSWRSSSEIYVLIWGNLQVNSHRIRSVHYKYKNYYYYYY